MKLKLYKVFLFGMLLSTMLSGCAFVSYNRVFPKLAWYWNADAVAQRKDKAQLKEWAKEHTNTNSINEQRR